MPPLWSKGPLRRSSTSGAGMQAERAAENYLCDQGLKPLERNYRCKAGEIDLVMRDGDTQVFVEVRYRKHSHFGTPAETVNVGKQRKLLRAVQHYLQAKNLVEKVPCRCDVVSITGSSPPRVDWIKNAF